MRPVNGAYPKSAREIYYGLGAYTKFIAVLALQAPLKGLQVGGIPLFLGLFG
jgi:hypothetical protein